MRHTHSQAFASRVADKTFHYPSSWLVRLRPRNSTVYASQGRSVMATSPDGFVFKNKEHGLWVYQSRMLSRYRWLVNGKPPVMTANSNLHQHSWLGYYVASPANAKNTGFDEKDPAPQTIELRLSRQVGPGLHEDVDVTNFSRFSTSIRLELEVESDFADPSEANGRQRQKGRLRANWRNPTDNEAELTFDYRAVHAYDHQGNRGTARLHRGIRLLLECLGFKPRYSSKKICFKLHLDPGESRHACLKWQPQIEGAEKKIETGCHFAGSSRWDRKRVKFLEEATAFTSPQGGDLTGIVVGALEQSKHDLAALRLYDLDEDHGQDRRHDQGWTFAAGLPAYV